MGLFQEEFVSDQATNAIPRKTEYNLENGLHVILQEDHFAPVVAFQMWVKVGSADEQPHEAGLAHVLEHMLFKGTANRGVGEIARDIEGAGGDVNAWTSHDETVFHLALPSAEFVTGLDILSDAIQHSALDPEELANELEVIREEIKRGNDSPQRRLSEEMFRLAFTEHPYRLPVIGTDDSVRSFTRDTVLAFYRRWYVPSNMTLVVVGDFSTDDARTQIARLFNQYVSVEPVAHPEPTEPDQDNPRASTLKDDVKQAHLALTFPGVSILDPCLPALDVIGVLLGQGDSSRLIRLLQRDRTLINDIFAYPYAGRSAGLYMIEGGMASENLEETLLLLSRELFRLTREKVGLLELEKAKTIVENEAVYQMQTMQGKARHWGSSYTLAGDADFQSAYIEKVRALTPDDLREAARTIFKPEQVSIVRLLPNEIEHCEDARLIAIIEQAHRDIEQEQDPTTLADEHGIVRLVLENGIRLIVKENHSVPLVSIQAGWLGGLRFETEFNNGINNLLAQMITQGTGRRTAEEIAESIDGMAGGLSGFSGRNTLGLKLNVISRHLERALDLFADCLLNPTFDEEELEKEKYLINEEIRARDESPSRLAFDLFHRTLYDTHPFRMDMLGTHASLDRLTQETLIEYYQRLSRPDGLVLTVVGDVSTARLVRLVTRLFGKMESGGEGFAAPAIDPPLKGANTAVKELPRQQTHLVLGFRGLTFKDESRFALDVMNAMLSGQGGRLFMELRDKQSLAYSVGCYHLESLDPGYVALYIGTSPEKKQAALEGMLAQLTRLLGGDLPEEDVEHAKRYLIGSHAIGLQTNSSQCGQMLLNELYEIGYNAHLDYAAAIAAVTRDDVLATARRVLTLSDYALAEVGPALEEE
jgi:zinc protease